MKHCPLHHVTYLPLKLLRPMVKEMHLHENTLFDLGKVTQNVAQCSLHHVTIAHTAFEVTTSKV